MIRAWYEWRDAPKADYAVLGDPVSHSLSPQMHAAAYRALELDLTYVAVRVPELEFVQAMKHLEDLGYTGVNTTVPLKSAAFKWSQGGDPRTGAVNTLRFEDRQAINTDAPGFLRTLDDLGVGPCRVLVLGAGGAARSVCVALWDAGFDVLVYNRTKGKADVLVEASRVPIVAIEQPDPTGCGLIVNATSAGLHGLAPNVVWESADKKSLAYDLLYGPGPTPFMASAAEYNIKSVDGRPLLVAQGALSFEWWTGLSAPHEAMTKAVT